MSAPVHRPSPPPRRAVAVWLLLVCAAIAVMVVLGGVTRLAHAGLSIVEWRLVTGVLPPLSDAEWEEAFAAYRQFPEYQKLNRGSMDLSQFKSIYWLEYLHRLWGRLIGVLFLLPFLWFLARRTIPGALAVKLAGMFLLGGAQGVLGWYMVKSGLTDRPDVSAYRLSAHLGLALLIYGYGLWLALGLLGAGTERPASGRLRTFVAALIGLVGVTILSGGFVAGLDAGFAYNTFPLMGRQLVPEGLWLLEPVYRNFFENPVTAQFGHRVLAILTLVLIAVFWFRAGSAPLPARARLACGGLLGAALLQVGLGIATLLLVVPLPLAAAHQAAAVLLWTAALWTAIELGPRVSA
ncbi:MAG: COX15/CtaA family protein [Gammaproteobacteria bacterium]